MGMTAAQRKAAQRRRDKVAGWSEVTVKVALEHAEAVRAFAASLPPPPEPTDPAQLDMLAALDAELAGHAQDNPQGLLL
jgi:hypothetical protein